MSYYIYGFRLGGDPECRYIGQTAKEPEVRLAYLSCQARAGAKHRSRQGRQVDPDGFNDWLISNHGNIEAFKIAKVETREEALATERAIIGLVLRLGHRLFNRQHVPAEKRIAWKPSPFHLARRKKESAGC